MKIKTIQLISLGLALALLIPAHVSHAAQGKVESGEKKITFRTKIALGLAGIATALVGGGAAYYGMKSSKLNDVNSRLEAAGIYVPIVEDRNIDAKSDAGYTGLMLAVIYDKKDLADQLLSMGADINATDSKGNTALILAAQNLNTPMVKYLLGKDAKVMHQNKSGYSAVDYAAKNDELKEVLTDAFVKERKKNF